MGQSSAGSARQKSGKDSPDTSPNDAPGEPLMTSASASAPAHKPPPLYRMRPRVHSNSISFSPSFQHSYKEYKDSPSSTTHILSSVGSPSSLSPPSRQQWSPRTSPFSFPLPNIPRRPRRIVRFLCFAALLLFVLFAFIRHDFLHALLKSNPYSSSPPSMFSKLKLAPLRKTPSPPTQHYPNTLDEILLQSSSFISPLGIPATMSALVFMSTNTPSAFLTRLLSDFAKQSFPPSSIIVVHPVNTIDIITEAVDQFSYTSESHLITQKFKLPPAHWWVTLRPYDPSQVSTSFAVFKGISEAGTDLAFIVDADSYNHVTFNKDVTETFSRAISASTHSSVLISAGGVFQDPSSPSYLHRCISGPSISQASHVHFPVSPFMVRPSWFLPPHLLSSLHREIEYPPANIAYVLARFAGIPSLALPLQIHNKKYGNQDESEYISVSSDIKSWMSENCHRSFKGVDSSVSRTAVFSDLRQAVITGPQRFVTANDSIEQGEIVFLLGNRTEAVIFSTLACRLSKMNTVRLAVFDSENSAVPLSPVGSCSIHLQSLSKSDTDITSRLSEFGNVAAWFYLSDSVERVRIEDALRSIAILPGTSYVNGHHTSNVDVKLPDKAGAAIRLPLSDLPYSDWIGTLPSEALRNWHRPRVDLSIITSNRPTSLIRLLESLHNSVYFGDVNVPLTVNMEQIANTATRDFSETFAWHHGTYTVRHRVLMGGLLPAVVEAWYPANNDTYGVLLEDDVELSPWFYGWLKYSILYYRYYEPMKRQSNRLYGVSLYQQRALEYLPNGRLPFNASEKFEAVSIPAHIPYLTPIPCSWGAVFFPEVWREFHDYLMLRLSQMAMDITTPIIPNIRSNRWPRSWKRYFIELIYLRGYTMLYPNYPASSSFSTNHLEVGDHIKDVEAALKRKALFEVPLRERHQNLLQDLPDSRLPDWPQLPIVDFWGNLVTEQDLLIRGRETFTKTKHNCDGIPPALVDWRYTPTFDARELLCKKVGKKKVLKMKLS